VAAAEGPAFGAQSRAAVAGMKWRRRAMHVTFDAANSNSPHEVVGGGAGRERGAGGSSVLPASTPTSVLQPTPSSILTPPAAHASSKSLPLTHPLPPLNTTPPPTSAAVSTVTRSSSGTSLDPSIPAAIPNVDVSNPHVTSIPSISGVPEIRNPPTSSVPGISAPLGIPTAMRRSTSLVVRAASPPPEDAPPMPTGFFGACLPRRRQGTPLLPTLVFDEVTSSSIYYPSTL